MGTALASLVIGDTSCCYVRLTFVMHTSSRISKALFALLGFQPSFCPVSIPGSQSANQLFLGHRLYQEITCTRAQAENGVGFLRQYLTTKPKHGILVSSWIVSHSFQPPSLARNIIMLLHICHFLGSLKFYFV